MAELTQKTFKLNETRALRLDAERIDPALLAPGTGQGPTVSARQTQRRNHTWGQARHYRVDLSAAGRAGDARVVINGFWVRPEADEAIVTRVAEHALAGVPEAVKAMGERAKAKKR